MSRLFFFADEAGCFNFSKNPGASRYFIVCTISLLAPASLSGALLELRRELIWEKAPITEFFHATTDKQIVRDRVYAVLQQHDFSIQATIMEKSKALPRIRPTNHRFYHYGWFYHFKYAAPKVIRPATEFQITAASVGVKKNQGVFTNAVNDVVQQVIRGKPWRTAFCRSIADPCLQAADYCTWAMQRKWEQGDSRSYDLIKGKVVHEVDMWAHGKAHHY